MPFGYGYGKVATNLSDSLQGKAPSFYLRKSFAASAAQVASQADLVLTTEFDDGIIIFLNGTEVGRCNLGAPGLFVYSDQVAFDEDSTEGDPVSLNLGKASDLLVEGENVLAVQVANRDFSSAIFFDGSLRIDAGVTLLKVVSEDFSTANGALRNHLNSGGSVTNTRTGTPVVNGWLDRSPLVRSGSNWTNFEVTTLSDAGAGEEGDGAISYVISGDAPTDEAVISFPPVSMASHWTPGSFTAANLSETRVSFRFKGDPNMSFDFQAESPARYAQLAKVEHLIYRRDVH